MRQTSGMFISMSCPLSTSCCCSLCSASSRCSWSRRTLSSFFSAAFSCNTQGPYHVSYAPSSYKQLGPHYSEEKVAFWYLTNYLITYDWHVNEHNTGQNYLSIRSWYACRWTIVYPVNSLTMRHFEWTQILAFRHLQKIIVVFVTGLSRVFGQVFTIAVTYLLESLHVQLLTLHFGEELVHSLPHRHTVNRHSHPNSHPSHPTVTHLRP